MQRSRKIPPTLWPATSLLLVALAAGTALGAPPVASDGGEKMPEVSQAAGNGAKPGHAEEGDRQIPDEVTRDCWAYRAITELAERYGAGATLNGGQPVAKHELVDKFVAALARIAEKYEHDGEQAITREDMESIRQLVVALENELFGTPGYRTIRTTIEQLLVLVEPPLPIFKYKVGVNGFLRGEGAKNLRLADLSLAPGHDAGRLLYRVKPFVYWHPNDYLDLHLEGQGYGFTGEGSRDSHEANLYQGFVEAKLPPANDAVKTPLALKVGRQEFNYGSGFMLGADSFYNGLTFDAVRLRVQPPWQWLSQLTMDLLAGKYAPPFADGLQGDLLGFYLSYQPTEASAIEAYGFRDTGTTEHHPGEHLDTLGARGTSAVGIFGLEYELAYQGGQIFNGAGTDDIAAVGGHLDLTGKFPFHAFGSSCDSSIFLSFAAGSGDKNAVSGNGSGKEFRNGNNDSALMGDMGLVGDLSGFDVGGHHASGMQIYTIGWGIDLTRKLNFSATGRKFMADKVEDGFSRELGMETDFTMTYAHSKDYTLILGYDHFFSGQFVRDASGSERDIDYAYAMLQFNYDWTRRKR